MNGGLDVGVVRGMYLTAVCFRFNVIRLDRVNMFYIHSMHSMHSLFNVVYHISASSWNNRRCGTNRICREAVRDGSHCAFGKFQRRFVSYMFISYEATELGL